MTACVACGYEAAGDFKFARSAGQRQRRAGHGARHRRDVVEAGDVEQSLVVALGQLERPRPPARVERGERAGPDGSVPGRQLGGRDGERRTMSDQDLTIDVSRQ